MPQQENSEQRQLVRGFLRRHESGLPEEQIASATGLPLAAVKSRLAEMQQAGEVSALKRLTAKGFPIQVWQLAAASVPDAPPAVVAGPVEGADPVEADPSQDATGAGGGGADRDAASLDSAARSGGSNSADSEEDPKADIGGTAETAVDDGGDCWDCDEDVSEGKLPASQDFIEQRLFTAASLERRQPAQPVELLAQNSMLEASCTELQEQVQGLQEQARELRAGHARQRDECERLAAKCAELQDINANFSKLYIELKGKYDLLLQAAPSKTEAAGQDGFPQELDELTADLFNQRDELWVLLESVAQRGPSPDFARFRQSALWLAGLRSRICALQPVEIRNAQARWARMGANLSKEPANVTAVKDSGSAQPWRQMLANPQPIYHYIPPLPQPE